MLYTCDKCNSTFSDTDDDRHFNSDILCAKCLDGDN